MVVAEVEQISCLSDLSSAVRIRNTVLGILHDSFSSPQGAMTFSFLSKKDGKLC